MRYTIDALEALAWAEWAAGNAASIEADADHPDGPRAVLVVNGRATGDWAELEHQFTEDIHDASMCTCGVPALTHADVYPEATE